MQSMTYREYLTWQAYLDEQWDRPDRHDYYVMQLTAAVYQIFSENPIDTNQFKLPFKEVNAKDDVEAVNKRTISKEDNEKIKQVSAVAKAVWVQRLGGIDKIRVEN